MPINNQSLGKDLSFTIVTASGNLPVSVSATSYSTKPMTKELKSEPIGTPTIYAYIPDGWQLTIKLDRRNPTVDRYFAQREADYWAGVNLVPGTILEPIQEADGSVRQYQYTGVVLKYDDAGDWKSDSFVSVSLTGMASRRIQLA